MSGQDILDELRMRLDDQGDDTQSSDGSATKQYFWSDTELLYYINGAQMDIFAALVDLDRTNELKNLIGSTSATTFPSYTSAAPTQKAYAPFDCTVDGVHAQLVDSAVNTIRVFNSRMKSVTVAGVDVIRKGGAAHVVYYFNRPSDIAASATALTEMTEQFYETVVDLTEYDATHKDNSRERIIMRRKFGEEDVEMYGVQKYLSEAA